MESKPQLHVSMLDMMSRCGIQFQRRYGYRFGCWHKEEIRPPSIALATGIAVHKSVEANMRHKMDTQELLPFDAVEQAARDSFEGTWQGGMMFSDEEAQNETITKGNAVDQTVALARLHATILAPTIEPVAVEEKFVIKMPDHDFDLSGQKDIREANILRDTKTKAASPPIDILDGSIQMCMYILSEKMARKKLPDIVALDFLVKTKTPKVVIRIGKPTEEWFQPLFRRIERFANIIKLAKAGNNVFVAADPSHWCCSPKYCGWHGTCGYVKQRS